MFFIEGEHFLGGIFAELLAANSFFKRSFSRTAQNLNWLLPLSLVVRPAWRKAPLS